MILYLPTLPLFHPIKIAFLQVAINSFSYSSQLTKIPSQAFLSFV